MKNNEDHRPHEERNVTDSPHLSPAIIAAYLAHEASPEERHSALEHLVACSECRRDMDEALALGTERPSRRWAPVAIPAAAAAIVLFLLVPGVRQAPRPAAFRGPTAEGVRQFAAVTPADRAVVAADSVLFVWRSEGSGAHYVITLTDANGDVVWTAPTPDTTLALPRTLELKPGHRYYWYVDALLENARSSTTGVREFGVRR